MRRLLPQNAVPRLHALDVASRSFSSQGVCLGSLRLGAKKRRFGKRDDREPRTPQQTPDAASAGSLGKPVLSARVQESVAPSAKVREVMASMSRSSQMASLQLGLSRPKASLQLGLSRPDIPDDMASLQLGLSRPGPMASMELGLSRPGPSLELGLSKSRSEEKRSDRGLPRAGDEEESRSTQVIQELLLGNKAYAARRQKRSTSVSFPELLDHVVQSKLQAPEVKAIILLDARSLTAAPTLVGALPGETRSVRVIGNVLDVNDGVAGAVEFLTAKFMPPVIMILGNSGNSVVESAVRIAMKEKNKIDDVPVDISEGPEDDLHLVQAVVPTAREALRSWPRANFQKLVEIASQLHIWRTIENLLRSSVPVYNGVQAGQIQIHGAYLNNETGVIRFLGEHPALHKLLKATPAMVSSRTATDPPVPADEALAQLVAGNARYASGMGGELKPDSEVRQQLSEQGQNPIAIILGCADSRAPTEILFDMRPGDLFVLRNAGNTCSYAGGGLLNGSVEFAISVLRCKLIVVNGHTQCGAVTGAVQQHRDKLEGKLSIGARVEVLQDRHWYPGTVVNSPETSATNDWVIRRDPEDGSSMENGFHFKTKDMDKVRLTLPRAAGSIGHVLESIMASAERAVEELPDATLDEQVELAIKYNVHNSMRVLIRSSKIIMKGVISGELQIHGSVYNLRTSKIEWLGMHPELENIVGAELSLFQWKSQRYKSNLGSGDGRAIARSTIRRLREGNERFVTGCTTSRQSGVPPQKPMAIVLASPEINFPIESMFDAEPGSIVVQRALGGLQEGNDMLQASIEYMVLHFDPKLLVVLGDSNSQLMDEALEQIHGVHAASSKTMLSIFSGVLVSALRAVSQAAEESSADDNATTAAATQGRMKRLAVEMNALYTIEQLLLFSPIIREAIKKNKLEIHVGLLDEHTGEVEFIGEHPMMNELIRQRESPEDRAKA